jgi:hypothetical protein
MPDCPNCGRQTFRTKDWVCQWCGYPLVSSSYKTIDKTYKELQDEQKPASRTINLPESFEPAPENKPEPRIEQPKKPVTPLPPEPVSSPPPQSSKEPTPASVSPPESEPSPAPPPEPVAPVEPQSIMITPPPATEAPIQLQSGEETPSESDVSSPSQSTPEPQPPPQDVAAPESSPLITPPPAPKPPLPSESKPEFDMEPEPPTEPLITLEDVQDGMEIAVEQIDSLFRADKEAANSVFADKTFIIQGIVEKVFIRDHLDIRYILLTGIMKGITWSLRCTFERENARELSSLQEGQAVTVRGNYDSYGKNIIFKNCALA